MKRCLKFVSVAFLIGILPTESSSKKKGQGETKNLIVMVLSMKEKGQSKKKHFILYLYVRRREPEEWEKI